MSVTFDAGEKTRSHYFGEDVARYTTIDTYRRPSTNLAGRVTMDYGRPADGYYAQKYPSKQMHHSWEMGLSCIWWNFLFVMYRCCTLL